jgi:hypothetical protein
LILQFFIHLPLEFPSCTTSLTHNFAMQQVTQHPSIDLPCCYGTPQANF